MPAPTTSSVHAVAALADDPRLQLAFPKLSDADLAGLEAIGTRRHVPAGENVWTAGDANLGMYVVVSGEMDILDGRSSTWVATHPKGHFSGDIDVLSGRPAIVSGVARTDLEVLEIAADCVRTIVGENPSLGEIILRAFLLRRNLLQEMGEFGPLVIGSRYSRDTLRIREFLARNRFPYHWEDLENDPIVAKMLAEFKVPEEQTPIVVLPNGTVLRVPSNLDLANGLGVVRPSQAELYDLVVIGAGPAGLAAAVYGASEGLNTLVVDGAGPGGQAGTSARIENYMGFPGGVSGQELADRAVAQAERFGVQMLVPAAVANITCNRQGGHEIELKDKSTIEARCVVLATGASYRKLDVGDLDRFEGRGVYYACTNVERILCKESAVAVVGAGNSAGQAAVFVSESSSHVYLVVRGSDLRKTMSSYLARRIEQSQRITVLLNSEICELRGDGFLEGATIVDQATKQRRTEDLAGIFVMIGAVPRTEWLPDSIKRDDKGFVVTGQAIATSEWPLSRPPYYLETSCPGVFAAGDVRSASVKRVASAVGEGSMSVAFVHQFLADT
ncbi:MAG: FAD-dependent oxidoreductase [Fimbriimonadaceae bacterium]